MNHDLFAPHPASVAPPTLDWMQLYLSRLGRTYRWALLPGTPTDGELPPPGFVLEYFADCVGWSPVRFAPRREEIWAELRKRGSLTGATEKRGGD